jgi:WD40 repeat protein/tRNA A-37 threonylcarbamoyl transferase component Bud32
MSKPSAARPVVSVDDLCGALAVHLGFVTLDLLSAVRRTLPGRDGASLGQTLVDWGVLSPDRLRLLSALAQDYLSGRPPDADGDPTTCTAPDGLRDLLERLAHADAFDGPTEATLLGPADGKGPAVVHACRSGRPGTSDLRFRILRPHARGGLGEVFVARDEELGREVALKKIQDCHADHPENRARFLREAEITAGLEHPGVVPVYGLGRYADGRPFYSMRLIRGESLKEAIERFHGTDGPARYLGARSLDLRQLLGRFLAVCNTVAYAHSLGVLHRDLKPANIMLGSYGETLVMDWGLARYFGRADTQDQPAPAGPEAGLDSSLTRAGRTMGTPHFMSPEQAGGRLDLVGPASDVYGLGASLYCLLTGKPPFAEADSSAILFNVQCGMFPRPRSRNRQVPVALEAICLKAMALRPEDRYASARALADDIEHWLADKPVAAYPEPWTARLERWERGHRGVVGGAVVLGVVGMTFAVALVLLAAAAEREVREQHRANVQQRLAQEAARLHRGAEAQQFLARRYLYFSRINMADRAWQEARVGRMLGLLEEQRRGPLSGEDYRGFEWYYLWRLGHGSRDTFRGHTGEVRCVAFSQDGARLASGGDDGLVNVWDAARGRLALPVRAHALPVFAVAFSPDGRRLASAAADGTVKVWDAVSGREAFTLPGEDGPVRCVAFSPDGTRLATGSNGPAVRVWDANTGRPVLTLSGHTLQVLAVAYSPDGKRLVTGAADRTARVWDAVTGRPLTSFEGHTDCVTGVAFGPDGRHVVSGSADWTARVWDAAGGRERCSFTGHKDRVFGVAFSPDGRHVASSSEDQTVRVWDALGGREVLTLKGHTRDVTCVTFRPDGKRLASGSADGMVKVWDAAAGPESWTLRGHEMDVNRVAFNPDGSRLATGSDDATAKVWDARSGETLLTLRGHNGCVDGLAFSGDGTTVVTGAEDRLVKVWDARTGRLISTLSGHTGKVRAVACSPDRRHAASGSNDHTVRVWDLVTGQAVLTLRGHSAKVVGVAFSADGRRLASASHDSTVRVWDAATGRELFTLSGHTDPVLAVAFSPDGRHLASASLDQTVRVWDAATGQEVFTLRGHTGMVTCVAFSPDGRRLATGANDWKVMVWDAATGQEALCLPGHGNTVTSVAFSPDGSRLASASDDRTVKVWEAGPAPGASP